MSVTTTDTARSITRASFIGKDFDTYVTDISTFLSLRWGLEIFNNFRAILNARFVGYFPTIIASCAPFAILFLMTKMFVKFAAVPLVFPNILVAKHAFG